MPFGDNECSGFKIDGDCFAKLYIDIAMVSQDGSQTEGSVGCGKLNCRNLIEQRLELLIIVLVNQGNVDVRTRCQLAGAVQPGKATADDYYMFIRDWILLVGIT